MKKIMKLSKIFLLITTIFSYIASPVAVLAEEIVSMPLNMQLVTVDNDEDGYVDYYELSYESSADEYDITKDYEIKLDTTFTYNNEETVYNTESITVTGTDLNDGSSYVINPISKYYDGTYVLDVLVYDGEDEVYADTYTFTYSTLKGLTGKLNDVEPTVQEVGTETVGNYDVTEGVYTEYLSVLVGELSPNGMYRVVYGENTSEVMTGEVLREMVFTGTVTDLTGKLAGTYSYTDTVTIEELDVDGTVVNTYTYSYNANLKYGTDNDELFSNMYGISFEDGYVFVNAKELYDTDSVITLGEVVNSLVDTGTSVEVLDEEGNILDLANTEVLAGEIKNGYVINFTNGASASYTVVVKGDNTLDNTFNSDDLTGVMEGYLEEENMPSMDMVTLEKEVEGVLEPVKEEFGTITFEDVLFTNELLKEEGDVSKEEEDNTGLTLNFGEVLSEIYVGDTFDVQVLVDSEDALDYIDGIDGTVTTSENLELTNVMFDTFNGVYNESGRFVGVGTELNSGAVVMTLTFTATGEGVSTIELSGNTSKFLNIDEFETITKEVAIIRNISTVNNLSSLKASVGTFDIEFDKDVTVYTLTVPYDTTSVILSGELEDIYSSVDGLIEYELTEDKTTAIVNVTAEDGTVKTYTIYIIKESAPVVQPITYFYVSSNNYLETLEIDGYEIEFDKYTNEYKITVKSDVTSLDIKALAEDSRSRVEITGNEGFEEGENTVVITVTAEDGSVREYKLIVTKEEKKQAVTVDDSSNTAEKVVIIVLIILVVLGLLYLIFKKDDEEEEIPVKKEDAKVNKNNNTNKNTNNNKNNKKRK